MKTFFLSPALSIVFSSIGIVAGGVLGGKLTYFLGGRILIILEYKEYLFFVRFVVGALFSLFGYVLGVVALKRNLRRIKIYLSSLSKEISKTSLHMLVVFFAHWFVVGFYMGIGYVGLVVLLMSIV
ncbi:MAG: hypothetical protein HY865_18600 [Chloroflexi bacterium]|nr:hypothetical protein [Chloroflexota bacterium]